jgi:chromosomal replication initiation ATPase DnaA
VLDSGLTSYASGTSLSTVIDRIEIKGHSKSHTFPDCHTHLLSENNIEVAAYTLYTDEIGGTQETNVNADETPMPLSLHTSVLPHQKFDGYWEALIYKEPIGDQLLRVLSGAIREFHDRPEDLLQNAWYNTALFSGPPGSGKTSLAQALAQQLAIRMSDLYPTTRLLQVDASAVFSHMYGGTAKEIGSMFATVRQLASVDSDEVQLVVVLIDEVDKLVPCRKDVGKKNEPLDTMRVGLASHA